MYVSSLSVIDSEAGSSKSILDLTITQYLYPHLHKVCILGYIFNSQVIYICFSLELKRTLCSCMKLYNFCSFIWATSITLVISLINNSTNRNSDHHNSNSTSDNKDYDINDNIDNN